MRKCDGYGGKLVSLDTCAQLGLLRQEMLAQDLADGGKYFIGTFANGLDKAKERMRSRDADDKINAYGYATNLEIDGSGLCSAGTGAPDAAVTNFFGIVSDANNLVTFSHKMDSDGVNDNLGGYICELDGKVIYLVFKNNKKAYDELFGRVLGLSGRLREADRNVCEAPPQQAEAS